jgi:hypothetical protein
MSFVGDDWAEDHHDVYIMTADGATLASRRLREGLTGIAAQSSNGLLGQYFPTGTDLNHHLVQHLRAVENELNNRACRVIADRRPQTADRSPAEPFSALLASPDHQTSR